MSLLALCGLITFWHSVADFRLLSGASSSSSSQFSRFFAAELLKTSSAETIAESREFIEMQSWSSFLVEELLFVLFTYSTRS